MNLKPFFCYYGGKWRAAPKYPEPMHDTVIEPFAGAAGYSTRYPDRKIILIEKDPVIAALWRYLINVSSYEILRIPLLSADQTVDDLGSVPEEAKYLVGFWLHKGSESPRLSPSSWMRSGLNLSSQWGERVRLRIAHQVESIRHWQILNASYESAPNMTATWFIDPPYVVAGKHYRCGSKHLDYAALGRWCENREGLVLVCENAGASWLPFVPFLLTKSSSGFSKEVLYMRHDSHVLQNAIANQPSLFDANEHKVPA